MRSILVSLALVGLLIAGCTTGDVDKAQTVLSAGELAIQGACAEAATAAAQAQLTAKGGALATANNIASYVAGGCTTANAVAALAGNPTSLAWLGQLTGTLNTISKPPAAT